MKAIVGTPLTRPRPALGVDIEESTSMLLSSAISMLLVVTCLADPLVGSGRSTMTVLKETNCTQAERENLAARAQHIGPEAAALINDPQAQVVKLPSQFLRDGAVYRVTVNLPSKPVMFTIGAGGADFTVMLPMNPAGFFELGERAGLTLTTPELQLLYSEVFLESTRDFRHRLQILNRASDIQMILNPSADQKARYHSLLDKYEAMIHPPKVSLLSPSEVVLFAVVGQDLQEIRLKIARDGKITSTNAVKEKDLPIAVTR